MTQYDLSKEYIQYNEDILTGKIAACKNIILACKRFKEWFDRDDIYLDYSEIDKRIRFVSKIKHFKGKSAGQNFILLPYQQWIFANIFGWKWRHNGFRVTRKVLLFMARKGGKTALAAALCLSQMILDKNLGQEIDFVANNGQQAKLGFEYTKNFAESIDPQNLIFQRYRDTVKMPVTKSEICVRNSESMTLDGLNSSTFIVDEFHASKDWDLYNVLKSSQGFQEQPLAIVITTAGFLLDGYPLYEMRKVCVEILKGVKQDDSQFSALYELDEEDDWQEDESCWIKANPSLGSTNTYESLREDVRGAINQPSTEYNVKTKNFNMFCQSNSVWIQNKFVERCMQPVNMEDFRDEYVYGGVDLSAVKDLTCTSICIPPNEYREKYPDKFIFKTWIYIPAIAMEESVNKHLYKEWVKHGEAILTEGNAVDYNLILKDQVDLTDTINFGNIGYDSYNATQYVIQATNAGLPMQPFAQGLGNFNKPTKFLEMLIMTDKVIIDYNTAVLWSFNNVTLKYDYHENCKPDKPTAEAKIDPVISITESLGTYLASGNYDATII